MGICHENIAERIDCDISRVVELSDAGTIIAHRPELGAVGSELVDQVITGIRDYDASVGCYIQAGWIHIGVVRTAKLADQSWRCRRRLSAGGCHRHRRYRNR